MAKDEWDVGRRLRTSIKVRELETRMDEVDEWLDEAHFVSAWKQHRAVMVSVFAMVVISGFSGYFFLTDGAQSGIGLYLASLVVIQGTVTLQWALSAQAKRKYLIHVAQNLEQSLADDSIVLDGDDIDNLHWRRFMAQRRQLHRLCRGGTAHNSVAYELARRSR